MTVVTELESQLVTGKPFGLIANELTSQNILRAATLNHFIEDKIFNFGLVEPSKKKLQTSNKKRPGSLRTITLYRWRPLQHYLPRQLLSWTSWSNVFTYIKRKAWPMRQISHPITPNTTRYVLHKETNQNPVRCSFLEPAQYPSRAAVTELFSNQLE